MLDAMLYIKVAEKAVQIGAWLHSSPPAVRLILILVITGLIRQHGALYVRVIRITCILLLGSLCISGLFGVIDAIRAMDWLKQQATSSCLAIQVRPEVLILDTSQCVKGLVKELVGPLGNARILRPKEGSNYHEGREVRYEVSGHNWHLRQFGSRFQIRKGTDK